MIATTELVDILDQTDYLTEMIMQSEAVATYRVAYNKMQQDPDAQHYINEFLNMKDHYEDVQRFGHYHPDYHSIMKDVRSAKRKMDMHETIAAFKVEERNFQRFLDDISEFIARSVSEQIMVPKDGLALTDGGCASGGCGSGGSCSCKAS